MTTTLGLLLALAALVVFDVAVMLWGADSRPDARSRERWWPGGHR